MKSPAAHSFKLHLLLVVVLAAAAAALGWRLYFSSAGQEPLREVAVSAVTQDESETVQSAVTRKVSGDADSAVEAPEEKTERPPAPSPQEETRPVLEKPVSAELSEYEGDASRRVEVRAGVEALQKQLRVQAGEDERAAAPAASPPGDTRPADDAGGQSPQPSSGGRWAVNVLSTQDPDKADRVQKALAKTPYQVYSYETVVKGSLWRRIRVGFFATKEEAQTAGEKLADRYNLPEPWIVRPSQEERRKYLPD